jgi:Flp pilus assembly protein TadD
MRILSVVSESETYDLYRLGREQMAQGRNAEATVTLEQAKRREPAKASIREALGIAYFRSRRFADAEREFRAVVELDPVDDYAHFALARCLEKQRRPAEAVGHLRLAASLRPERREYRRALDALEPS